MNFVRHEVNRYIKLMNTSALSLVSNFPVFSNALWDNWYQEQAKNPIQILIHQNAFDIKTKFCLLFKKNLILFEFYSNYPITNY